MANENYDPATASYKNFPVYCPVNGWDCPYFNKSNGKCYLDGGDPMEDCEDFQIFFSDWDDWENS